MQRWDEHDAACAKPVSRRAEVHVGDFLTLELPAGSWDLALMNNLYYFAPADRPAFRARALAADVLAIQLPVAVNDRLSHWLGSAASGAIFDRLAHVPQSTACRTSRRCTRRCTTRASSKPARCRSCPAAPPAHLVSQRAELSPQSLSACLRQRAPASRGNDVSRGPSVDDVAVRIPQIHDGPLPSAP